MGSGIRHDYKTNERAPRALRQAFSRQQVAVAVSLVVVAGLMMVWSDGPEDGKLEPELEARDTLVATVTTTPLTLPPRAIPDAMGLAAALTTALVEAAAPVAHETTPAEPEHGSQRTVLTVQSGDSLDRLFRRHDLSVSDLHGLLKVTEAAPHLRRISPGDTIDIVHDGASVLSLTRRIGESRSLVVSAGEQGYAASYLDHPVEIRHSRVTGQITSSFYAAGLAAGLSDATIMRLAGIYAWDIDFALDIRRDDWFAVVFEEIWQDGEKLRDGEIVAAEFNNQRRSYRAVRFPDEDGRARYYTPEGESMRKAFLRAPVDFTRVSSNFNPSRLHPILKTRRPHQGVDYAARSGTPIMAAGDGRVITAGVQGGYGNTVVLQHGSNVTTLYAHLSRFGPNIRVGRRVRQGEIIGYVGMTGLATAPHLHYEYRINGVHKNPRTVELPKADPVPAARREEFAAVTRPLIDELDMLGPTRLAAAD